MYIAMNRFRVAKGSGTTVQEVNKLLKMHQEMAGMMKKMKKMGGLSKLGALFGKGGAGDLDAMMGGAGLPPGGLPGMPGLPGAGGGTQGLPPGFQNFLKKR